MCFVKAVLPIPSTIRNVASRASCSPPPRQIPSATFRPAARRPCCPGISSQGCTAAVLLIPSTIRNVASRASCSRHPRQIPSARFRPVAPLRRCLGSPSQVCGAPSLSASFSIGDSGDTRVPDFTNFEQKGVRPALQPDGARPSGRATDGEMPEEQRLNRGETDAWAGGRSSP